MPESDLERRVGVTYRELATGVATLGATILAVAIWASWEESKIHDLADFCAKVGFRQADRLGFLLCHASGTIRPTLENAGLPSWPQRFVEPMISWPRPSTPPETSGTDYLPAATMVTGALTVLTFTFFLAKSRLGRPKPSPTPEVRPNTHPRVVVTRHNI
jgi:hypothetical protein